MQAVIPVIICGLAIEELAVALGISYAAALALYFGWTKIETKTEAKAVELARAQNQDDRNGENHLPWGSLESYRGSIKRGKTDKGNTYYYEKDYTHIDVEVYKKMGSKGVHIGSVRMTGGKIYKPPVPGRTIDL